MRSGGYGCCGCGRCGRVALRALLGALGVGDLVAGFVLPLFLQVRDPAKVGRGYGRADVVCVRVGSAAESGLHLPGGRAGVCRRPRGPL